MPAFLRRLRARLKYWNHERDLKQELDVHRALATDALAADGTDRRKARWEAARLMGNTALVREDARDVWIARWIADLVQDVRYAFRTLRREWGFAITATLTLAVGLGVLVGVFTVFSASFLTPWPVRAPGEVFGVSARIAHPAPDATSFFGPIISYAEWDQIRGAMTSADLSARFDRFETLKPTSRARGRSGRYTFVDDDLVTTIGVKFQRGDLRPGNGAPSVAITDDLWRTLFGSDPDIVGRTVWLDDTEAVVTGVFEPGFHGFTPPNYDGLLLARQSAPWRDTRPVQTDLLTDPRACCANILGRVRPGFTRADAAREIETRANLVRASFGLPAVAVVSWGTMEASRPNSSFTLFGLIFLGSAFVALLACANIGNLQLARGLRRSREIAVRLSLGASRARVIRQLLTESTVLSLLATVFALILAWTVPRMLMASIYRDSPVNYIPNATVVAFAIALAAIATAVFSLAPALRVTRIEWRNAAAGMSMTGGKLRGVLLAAQIALSLSLIAGAILLSRGATVAATGAHAGFVVDGITTFTPVTSGDVTTAMKAGRDEARAELIANPSFARIDEMPWRPNQPMPRLTVPGRGIETQWNGMNEAAAKLLRIPLVAGRWPSDDPRALEAVVSRSVAQALWSTDDVLGKIFSSEHPFDGRRNFSVVGVIDEVRLAGPQAAPAVITGSRAEYLPAILGPASLENQIKTMLATHNTGLRLRTRPLSDALQDQMKGAYIGIAVASGLATTALLLAALGVFGVFAYVVEERRREIGVRLALGASRAQIRAALVHVTRWPIAAGLIAGVGLTAGGGTLLRSYLFGLSVFDPISYLVVGAILLITAVVATALPLRSAVRVDPVVTLRAE